MTTTTTTINLPTADEGLRDDDFNDGVVLGELVAGAVICTCECDDECRCSRAWEGLASGRHTTLARINHFEIEPDDLMAIVAGRLQELGIEEESVEPVYTGMLKLGEYFPCGALIERRGQKFGELGCFDEDGWEDDAEIVTEP